LRRAAQRGAIAWLRLVAVPLLEESPERSFRRRPRLVGSPLLIVREVVEAGRDAGRVGVEVVGRRLPIEDLGVHPRQRTLAPDPGTELGNPDGQPWSDLNHLIVLEGHEQLGVEHDLGGGRTPGCARVMTTEEAAAYLKLSVRTLERLRTVGEGPPVRGAVRERLVDTGSGLFLLPSVVLEEDEDGAGEGGR
jgi:hypothetical protein